MRDFKVERGDETRVFVHLSCSPLATMLTEEESQKEEAPIIREERGGASMPPQRSSAFTKMSILIGLLIVALLVLTVLLAVTLGRCALLSSHS